MIKIYSLSIVRIICLANAFVIDCVPSLDPEERIFVTSKSWIHFYTHPLHSVPVQMRLIINEIRAEACNNNHVQMGSLKII